MILRYQLLQLLLVFLPLLVPAQEVPSVRAFLPADYGAENQNWALAQSDAGWIYAGNNRGLLEFDGVRWQLYTLPEKQTVRAVAIGAHGEIFCGGFAEFGFWQPDAATGRLTYHSLSRLLSATELGSEEIWHIAVGQGYVLFQSFSVLYKYDYRTVEVLRPPQAIMYAQPLGGRVLLPVIGQGLYELLPDRTFRLLRGTELLADKIVQFIVPGPGGAVWIGTAGHGLYELRGAVCRASDHPLNAAFRRNQLNKGVALAGGGWAFGTILDGVYVLNAAGRLRYHLNRANGLQNNTVLALHEDRTGNLWLGLDRGLDRVALRAPLRFFIDQSGALGTVYSAARHDGRLYLGTNQGVFVRGADAAFRLVPGTQGQVWQLRAFGQQLLGGHNAGTFVLEGARARSISAITGGWCTVEVPGRPDLLLQSTYTGLVVFRRRHGGWIFAHRVAGLSAPLRRIAFDAQGQLWGVHLNKGLYRLELDASLGRVTGYQVFYRHDGLASDQGLDLQAVNGALLVNTRERPLRLVDSAGRAAFAEVEPALTGRQHWLAGYGSDYFTIDSSGISLVAGGRRYFFALHLVPAYETIVALDSNEYLFCLENGYALLDRRAPAYGDPAAAPRPLIRRVEALGQVYPPGSTGLTLPYDRNSIAFYFALPAFDRAPLFSWRLDGLDHGWSAWHERPEKEFDNLRPGNYVLHVRADMGSGEATLAFSVEAPWYRTGWAWMAYALGVLGLVAASEHINRHRLVRQRRRLEAEKTNELLRQRHEAEREKLALEVENKTRELSNAALNLIRKNEVLQGLKDDLVAARITDARTLSRLARRIDEHLAGTHDWEVFEAVFNRVHDDFFKRLLHDYPELTPGDLRLAAYLRLNLSSKEVAPLLNISVRGVENKRYRLRKKLGLGEEANLTEFILNF
jgi:DNA-binding CsgD family transcriptional regulator